MAQDGGVRLPHAGPRRVLDRGGMPTTGRATTRKVATWRRRASCPPPPPLRCLAAPWVPPDPTPSAAVSRSPSRSRWPACSSSRAPPQPTCSTPEAGGSQNADAIHTLYWLVFGLGVIIFIGVEGVLIYSLFKYRARKGAVAAQIHGNTQLEIGWTVGAAVILVVHRDLHVRDAAHDPQPAELRRRRREHRRDHERRRGLRPGEAAAERQVAEHQRQRPAVRLALHVRRRRRQPAEQRLLLRGDGRSGRRHGHPEHPRPGRRALLVDPAARRQVRRHPEAHELHVVQDPADKRGQTFRGQCAELCGRNHANMIAARQRRHARGVRRSGSSGKQAQIEAANDAAAEQRKQLDAATESPRRTH